VAETLMKHIKFEEHSPFLPVTTSIGDTITKGTRRDEGDFVSGSMDFTGQLHGLEGSA
jgi:hypothetical protein